MRFPRSLVGVPVVIVAGMVLASVSSSGDGDVQRLKELVERVDARLAQPAERSTAIYGELQEGEAFSKYASALAQLRAMESRIDRAELWRGPAAVDSVRARELRSDWQGLFAAVRSGAHCRSVAQLRVAAPSKWQWVVEFEFRSLLKEGHDEEAVRLWLDAVVMAVDYQRVQHDPAVVIGVARQTHSLLLLWQDADLSALPGSAGGELLDGLAWLDSHLGRSFDWSRLAATSARFIMSDRWREMWCDWHHRLDAWRCGFSPRRKVIARCLYFAKQSALLGLPTSSWTEQERQLRLLEQRLGSGAFFATAIESSTRRALAGVRMLAMAVQFHSDLPMTPLADPLGVGPIHVVDQEHELTLVSGSGLWGTQRVVHK